MLSLTWFGIWGLEWNWESLTWNCKYCSSVRLALFASGFTSGGVGVLAGTHRRKPYISCGQSPYFDRRLCFRSDWNGSKTHCGVEQAAWGGMPSFQVGEQIRKSHCATVGVAAVIIAKLCVVHNIHHLALHSFQLGGKQVGFGCHSSGHKTES